MTEEKKAEEKAEEEKEPTLTELINRTYEAWKRRRHPQPERRYGYGERDG
jgi:hypothetical protein